MSTWVSQKQEGQGHECGENVSKHYSFGCVMDFNGQVLSCSWLCLNFSQRPVLLHCVRKSLWTTDQELLCQGILTCCVSSLSQLLSLPNSFLSLSISQELWLGLFCLLSSNSFVFVFFPQHLCTWRFYACHCSRMCLPWHCQPHLPCSKFAAFNAFIFLLSSKLTTLSKSYLTEAGTGQLVETRK